MKFRDFLQNEMATKATIYTSSQTKGATIDSRYADEDPIMIYLDKTINLEPRSKMGIPESQTNMQEIMQALQSGKKLPPVYVRKSPNPNYKWQIVDGHHRYWAYKELAKTDPARWREIPAKVIAPENISYKSRYIPEVL